MKIYDDLWDLLTLRDDDREALKKRGFSDSLIDSRGFKSVTLNNYRGVSVISASYTATACAEAGLLPVIKGDTVVQPQLINRKLRDDTNHIIIPYRDYFKDGGITKLRPHKMGFKGQGAQVYLTPECLKSAPTCVIAESEFKADAATVLGFSAIGIPGISSMSVNNWDYFLETIRKIPAAEFVICFDNEVKDDPRLPNYKTDWRKRYETIIYAASMAIKLGKEGIAVRVATLPDAWMVDGKIDIDAALAQGRTAEDFAAVIDDAIDPYAFVNTHVTKGTHKEYVNKRLGAVFADSEIQVINNAFWYVPQDENKAKVKLTNCYWKVIRSTHPYENDGESAIQRDIAIIDEFGSETIAYNIAADALSNKSAVVRWLMSKGNFLVFCLDAHLGLIWEYVFKNDDGLVVYEVPYVGYLPREKAWIFENAAVSVDGTVSSPDKSGLFWVDDQGFKVKTSDNLDLPCLHTEGKDNLPAFKKLLEATLSESTGAHAHHIMLGWAYASMFLHEFVTHYRVFPMLFLQGLYGTGKTTVLKWICSLLGVVRDPVSLSSTSQMGAATIAGEYSSLPVIYDDWRNLPKLKDTFTGLFLAIYGRQSGVKATPKKGEVVRRNIRASVGIAGEHMIDDPGVKSRCLCFHIGERKSDVLNEMGDLLPSISGVFYKVLTTNYAENCARVYALTEKYRALLKQGTKISNRDAINYAMCLAGIELVEGKVEPGVIPFIKEKLGKPTITNSRNCLVEFGEEFLLGRTQCFLDQQHFRIEGGKVYLWLAGIDKVLMKNTNRHYSNMSTLVENLVNASYYVEAKRMELKPGFPQVPCIVLDLNKMPEHLAPYFTANGDDDTRSES